MKELDVVALTEDLREKGLRRGQVGTLVESLAPGVYEVEFADTEGRAYAMAAIPESKLMTLHHHPEAGGRRAA